MHTGPRPAGAMEESLRAEPQGQPRTTPIVVWWCPQCDNYYGSSSAGDLAAQINTNKSGRATFARSVCPDCRTLGKIVQRIPLRF